LYKSTTISPKEGAARAFETHPTKVTATMIVTDHIPWARKNRVGKIGVFLQFLAALGGRLSLIGPSLRSLVPRRATVLHCHYVHKVSADRRVACRVRRARGKWALIVHNCFGTVLVTKARCVACPTYIRTTNGSLQAKHSLGCGGVLQAHASSSCVCSCSRAHQAGCCLFTRVACAACLIFGRGSSIFAPISATPIYRPIQYRPTKRWKIPILSDGLALHARFLGTRPSRLVVQVPRPPCGATHLSTRARSGTCVCARAVADGMIAPAVWGAAHCIAQFEISQLLIRSTARHNEEPHHEQLTAG
jgi:hypothetical protein